MCEIAGVHVPEFDDVSLEIEDVTYVNAQATRNSLANLVEQRGALLQISAGNDDLRVADPG